MSIADLVKHNVDVLCSSKNLIQSLSREQFIHCDEKLFSASIGRHVRHLLEYYVCFFDGLEEQRIDYDVRNRDKRIEERPTQAVELIDEVCERLNRLQERIDGGFAKLSELKVHSSTSDRSAKQIDVSSSISRELMFLHSHVVHHHAIIVIMLKYHGISVDKDIGVAPSTLNYERIRHPEAEYLNTQTI